MADARLPKKHICIDFEGGGKRKDGSTPHPSLLGALVPGTNGKGAEYHLWLFDPALRPMTLAAKIPGKPANRQCCSLESAVEELLEMAEERDCRLVAYSPHEMDMVDEHLPVGGGLRDAFKARYYNVLPKTRSLVNRRKIAREDNKLESLLSALSPGHKWPPPPACGVAEACRRLVKAGAKHKKWKKWTPAQQQLAIELIAYNRGDCKAVWRLVNRVTANYSIAELA